MRGVLEPGTRRRQATARSRKGRASGALVVVLLLLTGGALAASVALVGPLSPPPPPQAQQTLTLDGRFDNQGNTSYFDTEILGLELISVGYNPMSSQAKITQNQFSEPGSFTERSNHELPPNPGVPFSTYYRVAIGRLEPPGPQIVAVGFQDNKTIMPFGAYQGIVRIYETNSPLALKAAWDSPPSEGDVTFEDVATGPIGLGPFDYFVTVGHTYDMFTPWSSRGIIAVGQYSGGFIPPPYIQKNKGSWLYYTSVTIAEMNDPPAPPLEIVLAGVSENRSFLQVARYQPGPPQVINLANTTFNAAPESIPWAVEVADIDGDLQPDIVVGGQEGNQPFGSTQNVSRVSVWNWDGGTQLSMKADRIWSGVNSNSAVHDIEINDFLTNPGLEIASIGYNKASPTNLSMAGELNLMDSQLNEIDKMLWFGSDIDHWGATSGDPDNDGIIEIVTVGIKKTGAVEVGQTQFVEVPESRIAATVAVVLLASLGAASLRRRGRPKCPSG